MNGKNITLAAMTALLASGITTAHVSAQQIVMEANEVTIQGVVSEIHEEGFEMEHANGTVLVDPDEISGLDERNAVENSDLIKVGNKLIVTGEFDEDENDLPTIEARQILLSD